MLEQFIFGAGTDTPDAQTLQRRREMVSRLQERSTATAPRTFGEGLTAIGQALAGRIHDRRLTQQEAAERERVGGEFAAITQQLLGGGGSPFAAPVAGGGGMGAVPAMGSGGGAPSAPNGAPAPATSNAPWLRMNNTGTRNLPLSEQLVSALSFLPEMGVEMEVFSGGQPEIGSGQPRVGSVRHDHGNAADVFFTRNGERLNWANPDHVPIFQEIVRRGRAAGLTGFGAGPGYMPEGSMHIGFGSPAVWGAGGSGANAPEWLLEAFNADPQGTMAAMAASGPTPSATQSAPMPAIGQPMQAPMQPGAALPPQQPMQQPMQPRMAAPAGNLGMIQQLAQIAANPYLGEGQRMVAQALIQQQLQGMDPMQRIQMERAQLELDRLRNPTPAPAQPDWVVIDGQLVDRNAPGGPAVVPVQGFTPPVEGGAQPGFRQATPEEAAAYGAAGGQFGPDGRFYPINPPTGFEVVTGPDGTTRVVQGPGVGSRREQAAQAAQEQREASARVVLQDIDRALELADTAFLPTSGPIGAVAAHIPGTAAADTRALVDTITANIAFDALNQMRQASPTGGALGGIAIRELELLQATAGSLSQSQSPEQFRRNLLRLREQFSAIVDGVAPSGVSDDIWRNMSGDQRAEFLARNMADQPATPSPSGTITPAIIGAMGREDLLQVDVMSLDSAAFDAYERRWNEIRGGGQ